MSVLLWVTVCFCVALAARHRPFSVLVGALVLWCVVPGVAGHHLLGSSNGLSQTHPAALLTVTVLGVQALTPASELRDGLGHRSRWSWAAGAVVAVAACIEVLRGAGLPGVAALLNQLVGPLGLFFLLGGAILRAPHRARILTRTILTLAAVESAVAIVQQQVRAPLFWTDDFRGQYWFNDDYDRWMGTFDHPLILSLYLASSIFLLAELRRWWSILALVALALTGLLATQSRTGLVIGGIGFAYVVLRARIGAGARAVLLIVGLVGAAIVVRAGAADGLLDRFVDDSGSSGAREAAVTYFLQHWHEYLWAGGGLDSSFAVAREIGLETSFESGLIMYVLDLGVVTSAVYFGLIVVVLARCARRGRSVPAAVATGAFVIVQTFSGLSGTTATAAVLWTFLALAAFSAATASLTPEPRELLSTGRRAG